MREDWQGPINFRKATTFAELMAIVAHPAFRLGSLDAAAGKSIDHDRILLRIQRETPEKSLQRSGWLGLFSDFKAAEIAQYRYEEGRLVVIFYGLRFRGWGWPEYPPAAVRKLCLKLANERHPTSATPPERTG